MTRFVGGPYDGRDLPIDSSMAKMLRLPRPEELGAFLGECEADPAVTGKLDWPFLYKLDETTTPPHYRFVES